MATLNAQGTTSRPRNPVATDDVRALEWPAAFRTRWTLPFLLFVFVLLSIRLFRIIDDHAVNLLFWDQWDLFEAFMRDANTWELFRWQHGPHRQGIAFVFTRGLMEWSDWNTRVDAFAIGAVICFAAAAALWLRQRLFGDLTPADVVIPLLVLTPAQYGIFVHTPNASHGAAPLLLLIGFALGWTLENRAARCGVAAAFSFLLAHTGFGFFAAPVATIVLSSELVSAGRANASLAAPLWGLAVTIATVGLFFHDYVFTTSIGETAFPSPDWPRYPVYMALMCANVLGLKGAGWASLGAGFAGLVAATGVALFHAIQIFRARGTPRRVSCVIFSLATFSLLFCANCAAGRISLGLHTAQATRYVPLVVPLFLALYLHLHTVRPVRGRTLAVSLSALVCLAATTPMRTHEARFMHDLSSDKRKWVSVYLETQNVAIADRAAGRRVHPNAEATQLEEKLEWLRARGLNLFLEEEPPLPGGAER